MRTAVHLSCMSFCYWMRRGCNTRRTLLTSLGKPLYRKMRKKMRWHRPTDRRIDQHGVMESCTYMKFWWAIAEQSRINRKASANFWKNWFICKKKQESSIRWIWRKPSPSKRPRHRRELRLRLIASWFLTLHYSFSGKSVWTVSRALNTRNGHQALGNASLIST